MNELATKSNNKKTGDLYKGINEFKREEWCLLGCYAVLLL
jgi:hypothetical protein